MIRIGVVGCGYWGSKHVRVLHGLPHVAHVSVIDPDVSRQGTLRAAFPTVTPFAHLDDALDAVDAVVIATPPTSHVELGLAAIAAGKHVLIEKPLATSSAGARQLIDAARDAGVVLMVGHTFEHNAAVRRLRSAISSNELGRIHYLDSARLSLGLYQADVNVLWDLACHDISIANFVLDARPTRIAVWAAAHAHSHLEDVATLRLDYESLGVIATLRVSWLDPCKVRRTTVVGSRMMAVYDDLNDNERLKLYDRGVNWGDNGSSEHEMPLTYRYGDIVAPYIDFKEPLMLEDQHFVDCIRTGTEPVSSGEVGLAVVQVIEAAQLSIAAQETIAVTSSLVPEPTDLFAAAAG